MKTRKDRVMKALDRQKTDRLPKDLGGMLSTGISCFAYPALVQALALPERLPRIIDSFQMLALPDLDVLDALDCDVVYTDGRVSNAVAQPELWKPYDFNGRLPALVLRPQDFSALPDGSIHQNYPGMHSVMVPGAYVFDEEHGGEPFNLDDEPEQEDLDALRAELEGKLLTEEQIEAMATHCRRVRDSTDRAVFFNGLNSALGFRGGIVRWSMLCLTDPGHVAAVHALITKMAIRNLQRLLPRIAACIDVFMVASDDQGTQGSTILPPQVFRELYQPYYRQVNDEIGRLAPDTKRFLHSCGAILPLIDSIAAAGFQVLNPVQWTAGSGGFAAWKAAAKASGLALWGGGIDTQNTLPRGSLEQIRAEARAVSAALGQEGGYVFNAIHNLMADIPPEKILAFYGALA
jgi:uroporphyrinogen decarboxylase